MKKKKYVNVLFFVLVIVVLALLVCCFAAQKDDSFDALQQGLNIAVSICCSIIASVLFCILEKVDNQDREEEQLDIFRQIDEKLDSQLDLYAAGVVSLRKKSYYDEQGEFWREMIDSTSSHLDLAGHSCSHWFDDDFREEFMGKIQKMLKKGNNVRIILSGEKPDMNKVRQTDTNAIENAHLKEIERTCVWMYQVWKKASDKGKTHLQVYLADRSEITHMYIRTDSRCYVSPYVLDKANNKNSVLLEINESTEYSKCFERNFKDLLNSELTKRLEFGGYHG